MRPEIPSVSAIRTASGTDAASGGTAPDPILGLPVLSWRTLRRGTYRAGLKAGAIQCGIYLEEPLRRDRPTLIFIHGSGGVPSQFTALADALGGRVNHAAFLWDDKARLAPTAERLRATLLKLPATLTIVAHSMGTLLPAYMGATDPGGLLRGLAAIYLNPLIGGSRYAGDFRALRWLGVGPALTRVLFRPSFLDLAPEGDFQQTICGRAAAPSSFAVHTVLLFTERSGKEPDIRPARIPYYFGQTRAGLLQRLGTVVTVPPLDEGGHDAPLLKPSLVLPILEQLLDGCALGDRPQGGAE